MDLKSKVVLNIPGTKVSPNTSQLFVSSGITSLDELLGGGIPVGSIVFVEEDQYGLYSKVLLKYFLVEGIENKHSVFLCGQDDRPEDIISDLPKVIVNDADVEEEVSKSDDKMKIAFRYSNLPTSEKPETHQFGHYYDLSSKIDSVKLENADIKYWNGNYLKKESNFQNLLKSIKGKINEGFSLNQQADTRSILRIGIHHLGSASWLSDNLSENIKELQQFFYALRALVRSSFSIAFVTVPTHFYEENAFDRCIHLSDVAIKLQAFAGTELDNNASLADYHGFFHLEKLAAINSLVSKHPGSVEYVFRLRRKKFTIHMLHLPPNIQEADEKVDTRPSFACGSSGRKLLDF